jgi:hypothetical protein
MVMVSQKVRLIDSWYNTLLPLNNVNTRYLHLQLTVHGGMYSKTTRHPVSRHLVSLSVLLSRTAHRSPLSMSHYRQRTTNLSASLLPGNVSQLCRVVMPECVYPVSTVQRTVLVSTGHALCDKSISSTPNLQRGYSFHSLMQGVMPMIKRHANVLYPAQKQCKPLPCRA